MDGILGNHRCRTRLSRNLSQALKYWICSSAVLPASFATPLHQVRANSFSNLPPGTYTLTVTAAGIETVKVERISIKSSVIRSFPVTLKVATATKTVIVQAAVQDDYKPTTLTGGNIYDAPLQETPLSTLVVTRSSPPCFACAS
jgi:hypothetical protein